MMGDDLEVQPGQMVCVVGRGTANLVHAHYTVKRKAKTMFVVSRRVGEREVERRFRYHGREVGSSEYGGTRAALKCQQPRKDS